MCFATENIVSQLDELISTVEAYQQAIGQSELDTVTNLLNDSFGDRLAANRLGRIQLLSHNRLLLNVNGQLAEETVAPDEIDLHPRFLVVTLDKFDSVVAAATAIAQALGSYRFAGDGAYVWIVPDGFMAKLTEQEKIWEARGDGYFSHESMCISNTSDFDTTCRLEVLYEDLDLTPVSCQFEVKSYQSVHFRLDQLRDQNGGPLIQKSAPTSYKINSQQAKVVVQGSRILTSGQNSEFASFGTVMAWTPSTAP